jgi:phosphoribosyl 1,2-cyclic phosphodiesterase
MRTATPRPPLHVRFWGVRGSHPTSGPSTLDIGGHTSCVEIEVGGQHLIFDAGTGIIPLGHQLVSDQSSWRTFNLFLSHTHHDHVLGFYFFQPLFRSGCRVRIFGPGSSGRSLDHALQDLMDPRFFPVGPGDFKAPTKIYSLQGGERVTFRSSETVPLIDRHATGNTGNHVHVLTHKSLAHPNGVLLYRLGYRGKSVVYATDIEQDKSSRAETIDFFRGADLLIHDAQYLQREYASRSSPRKGWGHTTIEKAVEIAHRAGVKQLVLFHHDPTHDDKTLKRVERFAAGLLPGTKVAYEGLEIRV